MAVHACWTAPPRRALSWALVPSPAQLAESELVEMYVQTALMRRKGDAETSWRTAGDVLWVIHYGMLVLAAVAAGVTLTYLKFVLAPLAMAYFISFLLTPLMALFVRRPPHACGHTCCRCCAARLSPAAAGRRRSGSCAAALADCLRVGKLPHAVAVVSVRVC
jgi:hypothetical protein